MERIENAGLPAIEIYYEPRSALLAEAVGYGIEEEGLPSRLIAGIATYEEAYELTRQAGLGVAVMVKENRAAVFTRQLKEQKPLFEITITKMEEAKSIGKNAARIVKRKPFIDLDR